MMVRWSVVGGWYIDPILYPDPFLVIFLSGRNPDPDVICYICFIATRLQTVWEILYTFQDMVVAQLGCFIRMHVCLMHVIQHDDYPWHTSHVFRELGQTIIAHTAPPAA
jgi:hypothetical protein